MESYQPWTVINKYEKEGEPKTYEYVEKYEYKPEYHGKHEKHEYKPEYYGKPEQYGKWEKPEYYGKYETENYSSGRWEKPEYSGKWEKPEYSGKWEKPEYYGKWEKPEYQGKWEKPEYQGKWEKPEYQGKWETENYSSGRWEKPEYTGKWEKPEYYSKWEKNEYTEKPEHYGKYEKAYYHGSKPQHYSLEKAYGDWEKVCEKLERINVHHDGRYRAPYSGSWEKDCCCDEETIKMIKELINIFIGAEQSYIQLGFLCMDEKFTLVNTSEYFRLCGLRLRWLANGLIRRSVRLFPVHEWINNTHFENWFKVPTKDELATNDYTNIMKTLFKIVIDAERRIAERMNVLGEKIVKVEWNMDCKFDGFKWFVNFVMPYQTHFLREVTAHFNNIEMCDNGYIFDKCEMYPLVQKIEEFIHQLVKVNGTFPFARCTMNNNKPMIEKRYW